MIELIYSNRTEMLLRRLVSDISEGRRSGMHPLDQVELVVPNRNMETWVRLGLAQAMGVAANLRFRRLEEFVGDIVEVATDGKVRLAGLDLVESAVLSVLLDDDALGRDDLEPVRHYLESGTEGAGHDRVLEADGFDLRAVQLAARMALLYQEYVFSRPEMIAAWRTKPDDLFGTDSLLTRTSKLSQSQGRKDLESTAVWQRALWRLVFGEGGVLSASPPAGGGKWTTLDILVEDQSVLEPLRDASLPGIHVFGVSYVARLFQLLFARLGEATDLRVYTLNPCAEYWEDLATEREKWRRSVFRAARRGDDDEDPFGLSEADNPALRYWGRPGREHIRLLGELTECDFTSAFQTPNSDGSGGLLHRLQEDILAREPERVVGGDIAAPDATIKLVAAPSVRREVEWVADEIWRLMRDDLPGKGEMPLRFNDVAVIVNSASRDEYLPHIETVFSACHHLPSSVSDISAEAGSPLIEAMKMLLDLPFGCFSRAEMLALMGHSAVTGGFGDISADDLAFQAEALGIVFGADRSHHAGTYIDEDVYNWDQGVRRLALGAFMTGEKSGDERVFETDQGRWLVEELRGSSMSSAAHFGLLARSLIADARFVRERKMTLSRWARFYQAQVDAYLNVAGDGDERDRLRCLRALSTLEARDLGGKVSGRIAAEFAGRALSGLTGGKGQYLAEGVVISSFLPMRAIPFRNVFVLGLGEGRFPASSRRDALDLRAAGRRAGDVDPSERDRYMFLETLLCARDRLYLSYVRRDEQTGSDLEPSAVVQELMHILRRGYVGEDGEKDLVVHPPLRRHVDDADTFMDEARVEARVEKLGSGLPVDIREIQEVVGEQTWSRLSSMLGLPGVPPSISADGPGVTGSMSSSKQLVEGHIPISIPALRGFLECPMQGWAKLVLGLAEDDEDLVDREEEDFEVGRAMETVLLRESFLDAAASESDPNEIYEDRAQRLRLAGRLPVGALGDIHGIRHRDVLAGWGETLLEQCGARNGRSFASGHSLELPSLHRYRLGRSGRQAHAETVVDPLVLNVPSIESTEATVQVHITGRTEGVSADGSTSFVFRPGKPPSGRRKNGALFRHLLRGLVDHAVLSAKGLAGDSDRQVLLCHAEDSENRHTCGVIMRVMAPETARSWLTSAAESILGGHHAYLMPVEAVLNAARVAPPSDSFSPDGELFHREAAAMKDEEKTFSSCWGPVPDPRSYDIPLPDDAADLIRLRFGPLFDHILDYIGW